MSEKLPLISVRNLHKKFTRDIKHNLYYGIQDLLSGTLGYTTAYAKLREKEFWALQDINLDLYGGEILGIVGANGSGKTTLMRLIAGIYPTESGEIMGRPNQKITAVFALRSGMHPLFTGRENIYIKGAMFGMTKQEIDEKMDFMVEFSELGEKLDRPYGNYSSGMRARLAYTVAVATEPDVFIIDEALAVGDAAFKAKCFDHLKDYVKSPGKAVLFVSNNIRKILKVASRVLIMDTGKIIYNSEDITDALNFYVLNFLKGLDEQQKANKLQKIQEYNL